MKRLICIAMALLLTATIAYGASSVTVSTLKGSGDLTIVQFNVIANSSGGDVTATSTDGKWPTDYTGCVYAMETNPGATAPTANYDITLTDDTSGADLLGGTGANRSATATERAAAKIGTVFGCNPLEDSFTLNLTNNVVNSATITVRVFVYEDGN